MVVLRLFHSYNSSVRHRILQDGNMSSKCIGLVVNRSKWEALQFAQEVIAYLSERDREARLDAESAVLIGRDDLAASDAELAGCEFLITLGGDGTILSASHIGAGCG